VTLWVSLRFLAAQMKSLRSLVSIIVAPLSICVGD
jgi:hypothetical protein